MKPILFNADEKTFLSYGLGEINAIKAEVTRERNGEYSLYIEYPANGEMSYLFKREQKIKADAGVRTKNQTFEISRIVKSSKSIIKIYANHISGKLDQMTLSGNITASRVSAQEALNLFSSNLTGDYNYDVWSDIETIGSVNWDLTKAETARMVLGGMAGSILDVFGGEYEFDNNRIRLHKQLGRKAPTVLEYGRNIISAEEDEDILNTYTSIMPFASYTPQSEGEVSTQAQSITVTLPEKIIDGKYVNNYINRRVKLVNLSSKFKENEIPTEEKLRSHALAYVDTNNIGIPKINTKIEYVDLSTTLDYQDLAVLEEIELCDIVPIYYPQIGITDNDAKVVIITYDCLLDRNKSIELGYIGRSFKSAVTGSVQERLDALEFQTKNTIDEMLPYLMNGNGNRIWWEKPDPNVEHKVGDTWFEKNGKYDRIYKWNGEDWIVEIDTEIFQREIDQKFSNLESSLQSAQEDINKARQKADQALEQAGASTDLASEANRLASEAKQAHASLSQEVSEAKADLVQKGLELSQMGEMFNDVIIDLDQKISFKAEKVDMDQLFGRVSQTETQLMVNLGQISQRMTRSEVDSLINQKGYLSTSVFNNYKTETAQSLTQRFEEVRGLIPTSTGGANHLIYTDGTFTKAMRYYGGGAMDDSQNAITVTETGRVLTVSKAPNDLVGAYVMVNEGLFGERLNIHFKTDYTGQNMWAYYSFNATNQQSQRLQVVGGECQFYIDLPSEMTLLYLGIGVLPFVPYKIINLMGEIGNLKSDWKLNDEIFTMGFQYFKNDYDRNAKSVIDNLRAVIKNDSQWYTTINNRLRTAEGNFDTLSRTTMPNLIDSKITESRQIKDTREDNQPPQWYWTNYPKQTVEELKLSSVIGVSGSNYAKLTTEVHWHNASAGKVKQTAKTDTGTYERQGTGTTWDAWVKTANATDLGRYTPLTTFQTVKTTTDLYERILGKSEGDIQTNASRLIMTSDVFQTEVKRQETNADILARVSDGISVVDDPTFDSGLSGITVYDNTEGGNIAIVRQSSTGSSQPNGKPNRLMVTHTGTASPNYGGLTYLAKGPFAQNAVYVIDFTAMLPEGRFFSLHNNLLGTGGSVRWVTSNQGTGQWTRYVGVYTLGTGTIGTNPLAFLSVGGGTTPTTSSPLVWYLQSLDIRNITQSSSQAFSTKVTQLADSWAVQTLNNRNTILSQLNLTTSGVRIAGKLIHLDGTVTMDNAFIRKLMVDQMTATEVTAFMGRFGSIIATNIDVNNLTGNKAQFIQALFNGINSTLKITGDSITIMNGSGIGVRFAGYDTHYFGAYGKISEMSSTYDGAGTMLIAEKGHYVGLAWRGNNPDGTHRQSLTVDGTTGEMSIYGKMSIAGEVSIVGEVSIAGMYDNLKSIIKSAGGRVAIATNFAKDGTATGWWYLTL